jgi:hypothetical protein
VRLRNAALLALASLPARAVRRRDVADEPQPPLPADVVIPPAPALLPEVEAVSFVLPEGLTLDFVAAEPLVHDPIAAVFDEDARLWVVEMRGFMPDVDGRGERRPSGSIALLTDRDGDGRMDERRTFLDGLVLPRAVAPTRGGALVIAPPDVLFCRDGDGDGVADEIEVVIGSARALDSPEHAINGRAGPRRLRCANSTVTYLQDGSNDARARAGGGSGDPRDDLGRFFYDTNRPLRGDPIRPTTRGQDLKLPGRRCIEGAKKRGRRDAGSQSRVPQGDPAQDFARTVTAAARAPLIHAAMRWDPER